MRKRTKTSRNLPAIYTSLRRVRFGGEAVTTEVSREKKKASSPLPFLEDGSAAKTLIAHRSPSFDQDRELSRLIYSSEQSSSFLLGLTSLLFKNLFTFNLNLPDVIKQRCTVDHVTSSAGHTHRGKEIIGEKV